MPFDSPHNRPALMNRIPYFAVPVSPRPVPFFSKSEIASNARAHERGVLRRAPVQNTCCCRERRRRERRKFGRFGQSDPKIVQIWTVKLTNGDFRPLVKLTNS